MDVDTYFARTSKFLIDLLNKETTNRKVRSQATIWIRYTRDDVETVDLAFNSRMMTVYNLNDKNEIVTVMIEHMAQQVENPALRNSKFVFNIQCVQSCDLCITKFYCPPCWRRAWCCDHIEQLVQLFIVSNASMPTFCLMIGCSNDKKSCPNLSFCRVPAIIKNEGEAAEILSAER